jgi:hypothetical protein
MWVALVLTIVSGTCFTVGAIRNKEGLVMIAFVAGLLGFTASMVALA